MYFLILDATSSKPSPDPPFLFAFLPLSLSPLVVEASPPFPCSSSPKTVPKKIDIGGAPEEIFLDDDDCNSTEKADTSSIKVQEPKNVPVVNAPCLMKEVDLLTCKKQELTFCSPFYLEVIKKKSWIGNRRG